MPVKGSGVGLGGFRYGLFQKFMTSSGLLFPFSEVLSTLCALLCSVLCAGSGLGLTFVMVASVAMMIQGFPFTRLEDELASLMVTQQRGKGSVCLFSEVPPAL